MAGQGGRFLATPARPLAAICLGASADVEEAAGIMRRYRVGSLPVLEGGKLVGIVSYP